MDTEAPWTFDHYRDEMDYRAHETPTCTSG
jgi:hypothetical protein